MYLKALEIQGFKSFPDKTVLTFDEDITAVVGPNGSGKSNISDAIRWVMGEQSTKALRGGKMEDVIFGGTATRKQTGYAEVSLILDNTGKLFQVEDSEVMVTRRYYRSGESEYYLNRRSCRLRDINELFMDTGLGREGYAIIGQGRIDDILSAKSGDRREVFEEAAGISRFRHRKEEAERKLERTQDNLLRIGDKISELELQVEPLRAQSEKAKKFLILRDELRLLEISVWLDSLERLRTGNIKLNANYEEAVRQQGEATDDLERLYHSAEGYAEAMRLKDQEADSLRFMSQGGEATAAEVEGAIAVLKNTIQNNQENARRILDDLSQQEGREGSLNAQIQTGRSRLEEICLQLTQCAQSLEEQTQAADHARSTVGALDAELERLRHAQSVQTATASEAKALLSALAAAQQEVMDRDETVRQELRTLEGRLEEASAGQKKARRQLSDAQEERDALGNMISGHALRLEGREKKLEQASQTCVRLRMDENALDGRIKMLTEMEKMYEGFSKAVKLVMQEGERGGLRGIHGPVAGLLSVPQQYTVAIETALGGAMQNLVVESENDGKAAIGYLKRREGGRVTMLPLSSIRPGDLRERGQIQGEQGFVGIGDQLIGFDARYQNIFSNLLGRVVVMEDLDCAIACARRYGYRFRIVTLDGQVLNPGGSMTGGSASRSAGILSRRGELDRLLGQVDGLRAKLQEANHHKEEQQREVTAARYELESIQGQLRSWEETVLKAEGELALASNIYQDLTRQRDSQQSELDSLESRSIRIEEDTQNALHRIEELQGTAAALEQEAQDKSRGQIGLRDSLTTILEEMSGLAAHRAALEAERESTTQSVAQLEHLRQDIAGDRSQGRAAVEEYEAKNRHHYTEIEERERQLADLRSQNQARADQITALTQEKLALEGERNRSDRESRDKNMELLVLEREVSALEQKKITASLEEKQFLDKLWESYELSHEGAKEQAVELESIPKATRRIGELKREISGLGAVNVEAIEEFQRVNERYTYLTAQRDDVLGASRELQEIIGSVTREMKTIFAREFATINVAFEETFVELFGGGKATLVLEDPDDILNCGIEIQVQPPGKALKTITLLSGGEKAFTAIAIYFAILKVRPTPFVVMDEIEAALDDNNVVRFAQYLRSIAQRTQFVVITHRRGTMEEADVLYGVTMQEQGISRMLTINMRDAAREFNLT